MFFFITASTVQIYNNSQTESTQTFCKALEDEIIFVFGKIRIEYVTTTEISGKFPLLVICHNYSRIGTDIDSATHGLTGIDKGKYSLTLLTLSPPNILSSAKLLVCFNFQSASMSLKVGASSGSKLFE